MNSSSVRMPCWTRLIGIPVQRVPRGTLAVCFHQPFLGTRRVDHSRKEEFYVDFEVRSGGGAGPLTVKLTCDTGAGGSGTFTVTANGKSSTVTVKCGKSATVSNTAWLAGSTATIHQTAATASGQLRARDVKVTLTAAGETVAIRNFRSAAVATLAQTGGGVPVLPRPSAS